MGLLYMSSTPIYVPTSAQGLTKEQIQALISAQLALTLQYYYPRTGGDIDGSVTIEGANENRKFVIKDEEGNGILQVATTFGGGMVLPSSCVSGSTIINNGLGDMTVGSNLSANGISTTTLTVTETLHLNDTNIEGHVQVTGREDSLFIGKWQTYDGQIVAQANTNGSFVTKNNVLDDNSGNITISGTSTFNNPVVISPDTTDIDALIVKDATNNDLLVVNDDKTVSTFANILDDAGTGNMRISDSVYVHNSVNIEKDGGGVYATFSVDENVNLGCNTNIYPTEINATIGITGAPWSNVFTNGINDITAAEIALLTGATGAPLQDQINAIVGGEYLPLTGGTLTGPLDIDYWESGDTMAFSIVDSNSSPMFAAFTGGANAHSVFVGGATLGSGLMPFQSDSYDIGSTILPFRNVYTSTLHYNDLTEVSDRRLKTNIVDLNDGLRFINKLQPKKYTIRGKNGLHGLIAQEVEEVDATFPGLFKPTTEQETYSLDYTKFIPSMIKAIQELSAKIDNLQKENTKLKRLISDVIEK